MTVFLQTQRDTRPMSEREAEVYVASTCFKTGPPGRVGVEIERTVHDLSDPGIPVPAPRVLEAVATHLDLLPAGGRITLEPGGQLELSSICAADLPDLIEAARRDLSTMDGLLAAAGLRAGGTGLDAHRPPVRTLDHPRYAAMQQCFDRYGPAGRTMMCSTASLQVCLDAGLQQDGVQSVYRRWQRLYALAPVLVAMFANSPFHRGAPSGWASSRQAQWLAMPADRTAPPRATTDPRQAWVDYALDASLLCVRAADKSWEAPRGLTMRGWLRGEGPRPATAEDLEYHLTTLFPPVRPRGFLELRVLDTQAGDDWEVAAAVVTALLEDDTAADIADQVCEPVAELPEAMTVAARDALADPVLATAARTCVEAALDALPRLGVDHDTRALVASFADRHTTRGRCPANERLDDFERTGRIRDPDDWRQHG
jgi:glutamate--cysteine ligase